MIPLDNGNSCIPIVSLIILIVTGPAKTGHICAITEILFLSVQKITLMNYPETSSTRPHMSAFSDSLLPMLLNHEDAFLMISLKGH